METLFLDDPAYVRERFRELEHGGGRPQHPQRGHGPPSLSRPAPAAPAPGAWGRATPPTLLLSRALGDSSNDGPVGRLERRLAVLDAILADLGDVYEDTAARWREEEKEEEDEYEVAAAALRPRMPDDKDAGAPVDGNDGSNDGDGPKGTACRPPNAPREDPLPPAMNELPMPTQLGLRLFFRLCRSLRGPGLGGGDHTRLLLLVAAKLPTILSALPPFPLSPGLLETSPRPEGTSPEPIVSVFDELFALLRAFLDDADTDGRLRGKDLASSEQATILTAFVALSIKRGRLRDILRSLLLLLRNPELMDTTNLQLLQPLVRELAQAHADGDLGATSDADPTVGFLVSFGKGDHGKLGHGQCTHATCPEGNCTENKSLPTVIASARDIQVVKIDSLSTHSVAITSKGELLAWGNGDKFRLGHGTTAKEYAPRIIDSLSLKGRVADVACGLGHTIALMDSGDVYAWGNGSNGRLGVGDTNDRSSPTPIVFPQRRCGLDHSAPNLESPIHHVYCGASHSLAITADGRIFAWGKNNQGQCGHGHTNDQLTPAEVTYFLGEHGPGRVIQAAGGWEHTLFCTNAGRVYSCGCGYKDSRRTGVPPVLGHGDSDKRLKPAIIQTFVDGNDDIVRVACGWDHSLAISSLGVLFTWGSGTNGKLGHGDEEPCELPTAVKSLEGKVVREVKAGCEHTLALTEDHEVWTFGQGDSGRLGHGNNQTCKTPARVDFFGQSGLVPVAIAVGDKYNLVLVEDSTNTQEKRQLNSPTTRKRNLDSSNSRRDRPHRRGKRDPHSLDSRLVPNLLSCRGSLSWSHSAVSQGEVGWCNLRPQAEGEQTTLPTVVCTVLGHIDRIARESFPESYLCGGHVFTRRQFVRIQYPYSVDASVEVFEHLLSLLQFSVEKAPEHLRDQDVASFKSTLMQAAIRIATVNMCYWGSHQHSFSTTPQSIKGIHAFLDAVASSEIDISGTEDASRCESDDGILTTKPVANLAATALKVGFSTFFPNEESLRTLLWSLVNSPGSCTPRTEALASKLCEDTIASSIILRYFEITCDNSHCCFSTDISWTDVVGDNDNVPEGRNPSDIIALMITAVKLCSTDVATRILHFADSTAPQVLQSFDHVLSLVCVLQGHLFGLVEAYQRQTDVRSIHQDDSVARVCGCCSRALVVYLQAVFHEIQSLVKQLHKLNCQQANDSIDQLKNCVLDQAFRTLVEAVGTMIMKPELNQNGKKSIGYTIALAVFPHSHTILKLLDEICWQHDQAQISDAGNQGAKIEMPMRSTTWIHDLGSSCASLCGRLAGLLLRMDCTTFPSHLSILSRFCNCMPRDTTSARMMALEWSNWGIDDLASSVMCSPETQSTTCNARRDHREDKHVVDSLLGNSTLLSAHLWKGACICSTSDSVCSLQHCEAVRTCFILFLWFFGHVKLLQDAGEGSVDAESHGEYGGPELDFCRNGLALIKKQVKFLVSVSHIFDDTAAKGRILLKFLPRQAEQSRNDPQSWISSLLRFLVSPISEATVSSWLAEVHQWKTMACISVATFNDLLLTMTTLPMKSIIIKELCHATVFTSVHVEAPFRSCSPFAPTINDSVEAAFVALVEAIGEDKLDVEVRKQAMLVWLWPVSCGHFDDDALAILFLRTGVLPALASFVQTINISEEIHQLRTQERCSIVRTSLAELQLAPSTTVYAAYKNVEILLNGYTQDFSFKLVGFLVLCALAKFVVTTDSVESRMMHSLASSTPRITPEFDTVVSTSPRRWSTLPKKPLRSTWEEAETIVFECVWYQLSCLCEIMEQLDRDLGLMRWQLNGQASTSAVLHPTCVFLLGTPQSVSSGRIQTISPTILAYDATQTTPAEDISLSFWVFIEEECFCSQPVALRLFAIGQSKQRMDGDGSVTTRDEMEYPALVSFLVATSSTTLNLGLTVFEYTTERDEVTPTKSDLSSRASFLFSVAPRGWCHFAITFGQEPHPAVWVNGQNVHSSLSNPEIMPTVSVNFWKSFVCGGTMDESQLKEAGLGHLTPLTKLSSVMSTDSRQVCCALLDDVVVFNGCISSDDAIGLFNKGPTCLQLRRELEVKRHCLELLQLFHKMLQTRLKCSRIVIATRWALIMIRTLKAASLFPDIQLRVIDILSVIVPLMSEPTSEVLCEFSATMFNFCLAWTNPRSRRRVHTLREEYQKFHAERCQRNDQSGDVHVAYNAVLTALSVYDKELASYPQETSTLNMNMKDAILSASSRFLRTTRIARTWENALSLWAKRCNEVFVALLDEASGHTSTLDSVRERELSGILGYCLLVGEYKNESVISSTIEYMGDASESAGSLSLIKTMVTHKLFIDGHLHALTNESSGRKLTDEHAQDINFMTLLQACCLLLRNMVRQATVGEMHAMAIPPIVRASPQLDHILNVAGSPYYKLILARFGPCASIASKLLTFRAVTSFTHPTTCLGIFPKVHVANVESLAWELWSSVHSNISSIVKGWRQPSPQSSALQTTGGDAEISGLRVRATQNFPTVMLPGASLASQTGTWYYEVEIVTDGLMQIGYIDGDFVSDPVQGHGVGDHANSWAFDGFRCKKWNVNSFDYGEPWRAGDVVGVLLDTDRHELGYFLNGKFLGVAFTDLPLTGTSSMHPAASLNSDQVAQFNFGTRTNVEVNIGGITGCPFLFPPIFDLAHNQCSVQPVSLAVSNHANVGLELEILDYTSDDSDPDADDDNIRNPSADATQLQQQPGSSPNHAEEASAYSAEQCGSKDAYDATVDAGDIEGRQEELINGLVSLGFPLEWATRCATQAQFSATSSGAVTWILEQMERESRNLPQLPTGFGENTPNDSPPPLLPKVDKPINNVLSIGSDWHPLWERINNSSHNSLDDLALNNPALESNFTAGSVHFERTTLPELNPFMVSDCDWASLNADGGNSRAFMSEQYSDFLVDAVHCQVRRSLVSHGKSHREVDGERVDWLAFKEDIIPACVAAQEILCAVYCRNIAYEILFRDTSDNLGERYDILTKWLDRNSHKAIRFIRSIIGLQVNELYIISFEAMPPIDCTRSELMKFLKYESNRISALEVSERTIPCVLMDRLTQEFHFHVHKARQRCSCTTNRRSSKWFKNLAVQAHWAVWLGDILLTHILQLLSARATLFDVYLDRFFKSNSIVADLLVIATAGESWMLPWKVAALKLVRKVLLLKRTCSERSLANGFVSLPEFLHPSTHNYVEFFATLWRKESSRLFAPSFVTFEVWLILLENAPKTVLNEGQTVDGAEVYADCISPTSVTISWDFINRANGDAIGEKEESECPISTVQIQIQPQRFDFDNNLALNETSCTRTQTSLPRTGSYTAKNLSPDSRYTFSVRCESTATANEKIPLGSVTVQTSQEPLFELDCIALGKNLVLSNHNRSVKNLANKKWHTVRATVAFEEGIHKWQVRVDVCVSKNIFIGVCTAQANLENYIGSDAFGYGFLANKAIWHNKSKIQSYGEIFKQGDLIEVTLDCNARTLAFSRNGENLGVAATNLRVGSLGHELSNTIGCKWYPAFSLYNKDDQLTFIPPARSHIRALLRESQYCSVVTLVECARLTLAYAANGYNPHFAPEAYQVWKRWSCGTQTWIEPQLGDVIELDTTSSTAARFGFRVGDIISSNKRQYSIVGCNSHELWYETIHSSGVGESTELGSWSLNTCKEMMANPDEYPVQRVSRQEESDASTSRSETSLVEFSNAQILWQTGFSDARLHEFLEAIASHSMRDVHRLSYKGIKSALQMNRISMSHFKALRVTERAVDISDADLEVVLMRVALLQTLNKYLYKTVRLFLTCFRTNSDRQQHWARVRDLNPVDNEQGKLPPLVVPLTEALYRLQDDINIPSGERVSRQQVLDLARQYLFSTQLNRLIDECIRRSKKMRCDEENTNDKHSKSSDGSKESDPDDSNRRHMKLQAPCVRKPPFWKLPVAELFEIPQCTVIPGNPEQSLFGQFCQRLQLADANDLRQQQWTPEPDQMPVRTAFRVVIDGLQLFQGQEMAVADTSESELSGIDPVVSYLKLWDAIVEEVQSPTFPLFVPAVEFAHTPSGLTLDVNVDLLLSNKTTQDHRQADIVLLWFFRFGQLLGFVWHSRTLVPLQYLSSEFWCNLVTSQPDESALNGNYRRQARINAITAIRDGLCTVIPPECLILSTPISVRRRLSDPDVFAIETLKRHAVFEQDDRRYIMLWIVLRSFSSLERYYFTRYVRGAPQPTSAQHAGYLWYGWAYDRDPVETWKEVTIVNESDRPFVLELAPALEDAHAHPDACYPVVVAVNATASRLHLPAYSSPYLMRRRLVAAMVRVSSV